MINYWSKVTNGKIAHTPVNPSTKTNITKIVPEVTVDIAWRRFTPPTSTARRLDNASKLSLKIRNTIKVMIPAYNKCKNRRHRVNKISFYVTNLIVWPRYWYYCMYLPNFWTNKHDFVQHQNFYGGHLLQSCRQTKVAPVIQQQIENIHAIWVPILLYYINKFYLN